MRTDNTSDEAETVARKLAFSRDDMYIAMFVNRDFPQHRMLDRKYSIKDLVTAAQNY